MNKKILLLLFGLLIIFYSGVVSAQSPYPASDPYNAYINFPLDENTGGNIPNSIAGNKDGAGINIGATSWTLGQTNFSNALELDNTNSEYINTNYSGSDFSGLCEPWSMSFWARDLDDGSSDYFFNHDNRGSGGIDITFLTTGQFFPVFSWRDGSSNGQSYQFNAFAFDDLWHHYVLIHNDGCQGGLEFWYDGVERGVNVTSLNNSASNSTLNDDLDLGIREKNGGAPSLHFNSTWDDILIFNNIALSPSDIQTIFNGNYSGVADATPPNITQINFTSDGGHVCDQWPTLCNATTDLTPSFELTLDEISECRMSTVDQNFSLMTNNCTGGPGLLASCTQDTDLTLGDHTLYFACNDSVGNNNTAPLSDSNKVNMTILASDTCTCPASPQDYNVNAGDFCILSSTCNITGFTLNVSGTGNYTIASTLYVKNILIEPLATIWLKPASIVRVG